MPELGDEPCVSAAERRRAGVAVWRWALGNAVPLDRLRDLTACGAVLAGLDATDVADAQPIVGLKDLESVLEDGRGVDSRRSDGAVYTPDYVIDYLIGNALKSVDATDCALRLLDPSCGAGGFLVRAALLISAAGGRDVTMVVEESLFGFDVDPVAVLHTRIALELLCIQQCGHGPARINVVVRDALLTPVSELRALGGPSDGFHVVATNPPYVRLQNLPIAYRQSLADAHPEFAQGSFSLAMLFLVRAHRLLARSGTAALITQNNLYTSLAGSAVRAYLQRTGALRRIVDLRHHKVFARASAYTCLVFLSESAADTFEYGALRRAPTARALAGVELHRLATSSLDPAKWRLAPPADLHNLARLETSGTPLGEVADIRVGFATLKDRVFVIGTEPIATAADGTRMELEPHVLRRAIKVADVRERNAVDRAQVWVLYPYVADTATDKVVALDEDDLRDRAPRAFAYLESWRASIAERDRGAGSARWYEWGRRQALTAPGPKLLTKTFNSRPQFFLDPTDRLFFNGYSITPTGEWTDRIELLQALLESRVMHYYATLTSFQIAGGYQCYQKNFIERFCVPAISAQQEAEILAAPETDAQRLIAEAFAVELADVERSSLPAA